MKPLSLGDVRQLPVDLQPKALPLCRTLSLREGDREVGSAWQEGDRCVEKRPFPACNVRAQTAARCPWSSLSVASRPANALQGEASLEKHLCFLSFASPAPPSPPCRRERVASARGSVVKPLVSQHTGVQVPVRGVSAAEVVTTACDLPSDLQH